MIRCPFTVNRKSDNTAERPHRKTRVMSIPEGFVETPNTTVLALTNLLGYAGVKKDERDPRELLIDGQGVLDLISEFPEQLTLITEPQDRNGATYFYLDHCPFKGAPHRIQGCKTAIILGRTFGFSCFSYGCTAKTIGDLLRLLREQTGRSPSMQIWTHEDDDFDLETAAGNGVDSEMMQTRSYPLPLPRSSTMGQV